MTPEQATEQLFKAAQTGNVENARVAMDALADLNATYEFARTARDLARAFGHCEIVDMIDAATQDRRHAAGIAKTQRKHTRRILSPETDGKLFEAIDNADVAAAHAALNAGANVNAMDVRQATPLHRAAARGHLDMVALLINQGAGINLKDALRDGPLHWASAYGHASVARLLIEKAVEQGLQQHEYVNAKDQGRRSTPLHLAAEHGHLSTVQLLIQQGANVNAKDRDKETPLHWAAFRGKSDVVSELIANGAAVNANDKWGRSAAQLATVANYIEVVQLLEAAGPEQDGRANRLKRRDSGDDHERGR